MTFVTDMLARQAPLGRTISFAADFGTRGVRRRVKRAARRFGLLPQAPGQAPNAAGGAISDTAPDEALPYGTIAEMDSIRLKLDERIAPMNVVKVLEGRHSSHERAMLREILRPGDRVMELGGGIGTVAITAARIVGSDNVVSYEPNPGIEDLIRENYALNNVSPTLKTCLVGEKAGSATFYVNERFSRSSMIKAEGESRPVEVPVVPLADELATFRPNVLVVDIQGSEKDFIGYADLGSIQWLVIEFHPDMLGLPLVARLRAQLRRKHGFEELRRAANCFLYRR